MTMSDKLPPFSNQNKHKKTFELQALAENFCQPAIFVFETKQKNTTMDLWAVMGMNLSAVVGNHTMI